MLFIYGSAASGKLTVAREVAERTGFALFHNHLIVDALLAVFPFGSEEFVALRERFWIETFRAAVIADRSLVFTFCPELTVDASFPERVRTVVLHAGGAIDFIRLEVSEEEQERRLVDPSRTGGKLRDVLLFRSLRSDFAAAMGSMPAPKLSIDTTVSHPAEAADQILATIGLKPIHGGDVG